MAVSFDKVNPIKLIEQDCYINFNGDVTAGFSLFLPEVYTLSIEHHNDLHEQLVNVFKRLSIGCIVHLQSYYFTDVYSSDYGEDENYSSLSLKRHFSGRPILRHYANVYLTFCINPEKRNKIDSKNNSYATSPKEYILKNPFDGTKGLAEKVKNQSDSFLRGLNSTGYIKATRLTYNQLGCSLVDYFNLSYDRPCTSFGDKSIQPISFENGILKIGNKYVAILSLTTEPNNLRVSDKFKTAPGAIYNNGIQYSNSIDFGTSQTFPIGLGLPIPHILNVGIEIMDNDLTEKHLKKNLLALNFVATLGHSGADSKRKAIKQYSETIAEANLKCSRTTVNLIVSDTNLDAIQKKIIEAENAFGYMGGALAWKENKSLANIFFASCPGNFSVNYRGFFNSVEQAVCYFPKESNYRSDARGHIFQDRISGCPVVVDFWSMKSSDGVQRFTNRNKMVFGPSGTGKSVFLNFFIDNLLRMLHHVVMIDIGKSYLKLAQLYKGKIFNAEDLRQFSFNIFLCPKDKNGNYIYNIADEDNEGGDDKINFVYTVLIYVWKGNTAPDRESKEILKKIIVSFYDYINEKKIFPTLEEFYNYLDIYKKNEFNSNWKKYFDFESLKLLLNPYVEGQYRFLLNSKENIDLTQEPFIYFDLEAIKEHKELLNLVCILIIGLICDKIKNLPLQIRKSLFIDEAVDFLLSDMGEFIAFLYRTFRKKNGEVALATQNVEYLKASSELIRNSIKGNSHTLILLDHSREGESAYKDLQAMLGLTESDIESLKSIENIGNYREVWIKFGNKPKVFRLELSPQAYGLYTSDPDDNAEIYKLYQKYGNLATAINQYVENKFKSVA